MSKINTLQFKINSMEELIAKHEEMELREMMNAQNASQDDGVIKPSPNLGESQIKEVQNIVGQEVNPDTQAVKAATANINSIINPVLENKPEDPTPGENEVGLWFINFRNQKLRRITQKDSRTLT